MKDVEIKCPREAIAQALLELGKKNPNVVVLTADLAKSTRTSDFGEAFPERFFNMGVAEANMMNTAAGLALAGKIPYAGTFAIFASGRAFEQVRNTIGYASLNVKIIATHSGVCVGEDGASHQGIEDIALMRAIPTMTILSPCDAYETRKAVLAASEIKGPVYIRLVRVKLPVVTKPDDPFTVGQANILRKGKDITLIATGIMVSYALEAAEMLDKENISASVVNMHTIKPLDETTVINQAKISGAVVTVEEHLITGGLGSAVSEVLGRNHPVPVEMIGIQNQFGQSGSHKELFEAYHLTSLDIYKAAKKAMDRK